MTTGGHYPSALCQGQGVQCPQIAAGVSRYRLFQSLHNFVRCHGSQHFVHFRDFLLDFLPVALCQTAAYQQRFNLTGLFQFCHLQNVLDTFLFSIPDETAAIYHHCVRVLLRVRKAVTMFQKLSQHFLGIYQIFVTAK